MRIAFADFIDWDYKVESAYEIPLGGSQSALCYLAESLAKLGHDIFLLNQCKTRSISRGVDCVPLTQLPSTLLRSLDAVVVLNSAESGAFIRPHLTGNSLLILWEQHAHDQPGAQILADSRISSAYDSFAFISDWQCDQFIDSFQIKKKHCYVLRNAIAPSFECLFSADADITSQKYLPPVLAYISTPFRGLKLLLDSFPEIWSHSSENILLKVFSSMKVYQVSENYDESEFGKLYRKCHDLEGVEYIGSLPQPELAEELRNVSILAYPNTFAETSCIAVMEAMASGCRVVTSELGALPETTAGFASLIPVTGDWVEYKKKFVLEMGKVIREFSTEEMADTQKRLKQQVEYFNSECVWDRRAVQWSDWLKRLHRSKRG